MEAEKKQDGDGHGQQVNDDAAQFVSMQHKEDDPKANDENPELSKDNNESIRQQYNVLNIESESKPSNSG